MYRACPVSSVQAPEHLTHRHTAAGRFFKHKLQATIRMQQGPLRAAGLFRAGSARLVATGQAGFRVVGSAAGFIRAPFWCSTRSALLAVTTEQTGPAVLGLQNYQCGW
jgi:hypothetical protein